MRRVAKQLKGKQQSPKKQRGNETALIYIQVCLVTVCVVTSNGVYLVIACLSWKQHTTVNYVRPRGYSI